MTNLYISAETQGNQVVVWEKTPSGNRVTKKVPADWYFYVPHKKGNERSAKDGTSLKKLSFSNSAEFNEARRDAKIEGYSLFDSDVGPELKHLSDNYYKLPAPSLNISFYDIEIDSDPTVEFKGALEPKYPVNSISIYNNWEKQRYVIAVPPEDWDGELDEELHTLANVIICKTERELLRHFLNIIENSDCLVGYNSESFDDPYICKRVQQVLGNKASLQLGFPNGTMPYFQEMEVMGRPQIRVNFSGRLQADYLQLIRKFEPGERQSYKLASIAQDYLPHLPKLEYRGNLHDLYRDSFSYFIRYNIRDTEILEGLEEKLHYVQIANELYHLSTGQMSQIGGTVKLADLAIRNFCRYERQSQGPDWVDRDNGQTIEGAIVLSPLAAMIKLIMSVDINSLYPSAIMTCNISFDTIIGQFLLCEADFVEIRNETDKTLRFVYENGEVIEKTAREWKTFLLANNLCISGYGTVFTMDRVGIIPSILAEWFALRVEYKNKMKTAETKEQKEHFDRLQYVYKIKLNSLYGALSNKYFRYYDLRLGASTTATGRHILMHQVCEIDRLVGNTKLNSSTPLQHSGVFAIDSDSVVYGDSVTRDTIITTDKGDMRIEDLFTSIDDTRGDKTYCTTNMPKVLTYDVETKSIVFKPIKYVMKHECDKKVYRVWITNSQYVDVTEDHSLMGYVNLSKRQKYGSIITEIKPKDLGNDIKSLVYQNSLPNLEPKSLDLHPLVYLFMGYVMGDGFVDFRGNGCIDLSIGNQDMDEMEEKLLRPMLEQGLITSYCRSPNGHDVKVHGGKLCKELRALMYANDTPNKHVPSFLFRETVLNIGLFLKGWFSADGFANKRHIVGLCSVTTEHITDVHKLLLLCGISSTWCTEGTENSFNGAYSGTFTKRLTIRDNIKFNDLVGFIQNRKSSLVPTTTRKQWLDRDGFDIVPIHEIQELEYNDHVYDIEVEDTHTFFANNILVHNTDSCYFAYPNQDETDMDKVIAFADDTAKRVNQSFTPFVRDTFLVRGSFDNKIKCVREIVASGGIFVTKKRYILHVIDKEGKRVDEPKVMGLDIKKSNLPMYIQEHLTDWVLRFIKGHSWTTLSDDMLAFKSEVRSKTIFELGLPKGVKRVEHYQNELNTLGQKARLPGHVRAAILYNRCREEYQDWNSPQITSGNKIRIFKLKDPIGKFKAIALPSDLEEIPQWFMDNVDLNIEQHVKSLVDDPLDNILCAVGKHTPSLHTQMLETFMEYDYE